MMSAVAESGAAEELKEGGYGQLPVERAPASVGEIWSTAHLGLKIRDVGEELTDPLFYRAVIGEWFATMGFLVFSLLPWLSLSGDVGTDAPGLRVALASGVSYFTLHYMFAGVSGGHMNPAVSLGLMLGKRITAFRALAYVVAQLVGAITGAAIVRGINPMSFRRVLGGANFPMDVTEGQSLVLEIIGSLLLVLAFFFATDRKRANFFPSIPLLASWEVGMAVLVAHLSLLPFTRCAINPARAFGASVAANHFRSHWVFWVGPLLGALIAALIYEIVFRANYFQEPISRPVVTTTARAPA